MDNETQSGIIVNSAPIEKTNNTMKTFIENINEYLKGKSIKNSYVSMITGWDKSKVSRLLNGEVDIRMDDAQQLSEALGKDLAFFLEEREQLLQDIHRPRRFVFYAGRLENKDRALAKNMLDLFRYYDSLVDLDD